MTVAATSAAGAELRFFDPAALQRVARDRRDEYAAAAPFPHLVIDDFLPTVLARAVATEFSSPPAEAWIAYRSGVERRLTLRDETLMGLHARHVFAELRGTAFLRFLETLTAIDGLIASPHHEGGGGLYQSERGCLLRVHADFNRAERLALDRRLNVIVYLTEGWRDEWGGELELWARSGTRCERRIAPRFNRAVVFGTNDTTFHGHPEPLRCPPGELRRSLALYYFTNGRPADEATATHRTRFLPRTGDAGRSRLRALARRCVPPLVFDVARRLRRGSF